MASSAYSVLIVDDMEVNRSLLERRLQNNGFRLSFAENGHAALEKVRNDSIDLVLLDIMMPGIDGFQVLSTMKADEKLCHIPVIMISALNEINGVARCIEMGAEDYLSKPFNPTLLQARINACLEKKSLHDLQADYRSRIEIHNRRARLAEDPSPRQYCVRQGWLERSGEIAICLPNEVSVELTGGVKRYDSLNY